MKHRIDAEVPPVPVAGRGARPPSDLVCDVFVLLLGAWTLVCHAVVFRGGSFETLLVTAAWTGAILLPAGIALLLRRRGRSEPLPVPPPSATPGGRSRGDRLFLALAVVVALLPLVGVGARLLWWAVVLLFGALAWRSRRAPAPASCGAAVCSPWSEAALWALALAAGLFAVSVHVTSPDDGYYVNVAVAALDQPALPLLSRDTLHGVDAPLMYSVYRVHSHELLIAAVARLSGRMPLRVAHAWLPLLFGLLVVLAHGRLARELAPRRWLLVTLGAVLFLALVNETPQYHGRFAFARLQQGKAVFLSGLAPLVVVYALGFAGRPSPGRWALLALAQIASVGMTSTALWCVPAVAGLALLAGVAWDRRGLARLLVGLSSSTYVVFLGLVFRGDSLRQTAAETGAGVRLVRITNQAIADGGELVGEVWRVVFGSGAFAWTAFAAVVVAWACVPAGRARRWLVVLPLGVALAFVNPYTALDVARSVTGAITYWRALWLVPVPLLLALVLTRPWEGGRSLRPARRAAAVLLLALGLGLVPTRFFLEPRKGVVVQPFGLKILGEPLNTALAVRALSRPGDCVLVAKGASQWIPAFRHHPYPLVTRRNYLELLAPWLEPGEAESRRRLFDYVSGDSEVSEATLFRRALGRYRPTVVTFRLEGAFADEIRRLLKAAGYRPAVRLNVSEVWKRVE